MLESRKDTSLTPDALWVPLTDEVLESEHELWTELIDQFEPAPHQAGEDAVGWLRDAIQAKSMPSKTYAVRTSSELLGFYAVEQALVDITPRAWPMVELRRKLSGQPRQPQPGLILSWIVRSRSTAAGFGRTLFQHVVGLALSDRAIVAIFVSPANRRVSQMWLKTYGFQAMDKPVSQATDLLWFPVNPSQGGDWPS